MSGEVEIKKTHCQFCQNYCGVLVHVKDGQVIRSQPNRDHPISHGFTCERNKRAVEWLYQPQQLMYPLKRVGERGEGKWQRVTWADALGEIGDKLKAIRAKHGPEALGAMKGTLRGNDSWIILRFLSHFGNPANVFSPGTICGLNLYSLSNAVMGDCASFSKDVDHTNCLLIWGCEAEEAWERYWVRALKARKERGIKIITIDPRRTSAAEKADIRLQLRPGTDAALALGWLNVIITERLYDKEFVEKWTVGFDKLAERVQEYPPERVAQITGLPRDQIVESARMYATIKPAMILYGVATDEIGYTATTIEHAKIGLRALTGNIGRLGGDLIARPGEKVNGGVFVTGAELAALDKIPPEQRKKQVGYEESSLISLKGYDLTAGPIREVYGVPAPAEGRIAAHTSLLWSAILEGKPYAIKAFVCWQSNPLLWAGPVKKIYQALKSPNLDLHVIQEMFMTPTAQLA
ncbi:MAG: molybdopterin-dependent oxidoreductase, partial [Chloroflexi bacterium]|nr:molybdopterin-dependent oxidoreductase [Chloroflexota bacterium]